MVQAPAELGSELARRLGSGAISDAGPGDAVDGVQPRLVVEPGTAEELAQALACATENRARVIPRGGGTRLEWGNPPRGAEVVLSTARLNRVLEHAAGDMTVTVEAGVTLGQLQRKVGEAGQMLALDVPNADRATIGGLIATDDSGSLRYRYGGLRDLLIGVRVVLADGVLARGGGKVVKNVAGYDLPKLYTGSLGTLGVIVEATLRLHPAPRAEASIVLRAADAETATGVLVDVLASQMVPTAVAVRSQGDERQAEAWLRFGGTQGSVDLQVREAGELAARHGCSVAPAFEACGSEWEALSEAVWSGGPSGVVARVGILPGDVGWLLETARRSGEGAGQVLVYGHGLGFIAWDAATAEGLARLRGEVAQRGGTLSVLRAPVAVKRGLGDVWGIASDVLPLMQRVKQRFDPSDTLNPGRLLPSLEETKPFTQS